MLRSHLYFDCGHDTRLVFDGDHYQEITSRPMIYVINQTNMASGRCMTHLYAVDSLYTLLNSMDTAESPETGERTAMES